MKTVENWLSSSDYELSPLAKDALFDRPLILSKVVRTFEAALELVIENCMEHKELFIPMYEAIKLKNHPPFAKAPSYSLGDLLHGYAHNGKALPKAHVQLLSQLYSYKDPIKITCTKEAISYFKKEIERLELNIPEWWVSDVFIARARNTDIPDLPIIPYQEGDIVKLRGISGVIHKSSGADRSSNLGERLGSAIQTISIDFSPNVPNGQFGACTLSVTNLSLLYYALDFKS
jgi:hypothetical protein